MRISKQCVLIATIIMLTLPGCGLANVVSDNADDLPGESPASDEFTIVRLNRADGQLAELLKAEAAKARQLGQTPFVEFYADWCPPCNALRQSLGDEQMVDAFAGTYIIQLDTDEWKSKLPGTGFDVRGIPAFFELDHEGRPTGRTITGAAWGEDVPENMAPPLKSFFQKKAQ